MLSRSEIWIKYKKLMYNISKASFVSLFIFLIIFFLAFKSSIIKALSPLSVSILIFGTFLITLVLSSKKIPRATLTELKELYPEVPSIIMGIGFSLLLITFVVVLNIPSIVNSKVYWLILIPLGVFSFILIPIGFFLLIVSLSAKKYLEGSFTLNKDTIIQVIGLIVPIMLFILSMLYSNTMNPSFDLSKQALCLQKNAEYRDIAPPSIVVNLKEGRIFKDNRTAKMTFRFHLIPNSKTFFYPDANLDIGEISNFSLGGFKDNSGMYYLDNMGNIINYFNGYSGNLNNSIYIHSETVFPSSLDYRNETTMDITYDIDADVHSDINFSLYHQKPINVPINFTFELKDINGDKYNDTVFYNINVTAGAVNTDSIYKPKVFDFKKPGNYSC